MIVTLTTDFGLADEFVGVMKGVILKVNPEARIVDISHAVPPRDILSGSLALAAAAPYFPLGTVHTAVVDPGVGTRRRIVAMKARGQIFLAPDNGLLTPILAWGTPDRAVFVENTAYFLPRVSSTFHGRDVFAPVAGYLTRGVNLGEMGPKARPEELVRLDLPRPEVRENRLAGQVLSADRFGNLVTNIDAETLRTFLEETGPGRPVIRAGEERIERMAATFGDVGPGDLAAIMGSRGYLEIAVNGGSARERLGAERGFPVTLTRD